MRWLAHWTTKLAATWYACAAWLLASLKGWRTVAVNVCAAVMPILELSEMTQIMPPGWLPYYTIALTAVNLWLRAVTSTPIGRRHV